MTARRMLPQILIAAAVGCSGGAQDAADSDSQKARSSLFTALDAWKKGEAKTLTDRDPPIQFVDRDYTAGMRLSNYAIQEPDRPIALDQDIPVTLSLRDARGKTIRHVATYRVTTSPTLAVQRSDQR